MSRAIPLVATLLAACATASSPCPEGYEVGDDDTCLHVQQGPPMVDARSSSTVTPLADGMPRSSSRTVA